MLWGRAKAIRHPPSASLSYRRSRPWTPIRSPAGTRFRSGPARPAPHGDDENGNPKSHRSPRRVYINDWATREKDVLRDLSAVRSHENARALTHRGAAATSSPSGRAFRRTFLPAEGAFPQSCVPPPFCVPLCKAGRPQNGRSRRDELAEEAAFFGDRLCPSFASRCHPARASCLRC